MDFTWCGGSEKGVEDEKKRGGGERDCKKSHTYTMSSDKKRVRVRKKSKGKKGTACKCEHAKNFQCWTCGLKLICHECNQSVHALHETHEIQNLLKPLQDPTMTQQFG